MVDEEQKPMSVLVTRNYHIALKAGIRRFSESKAVVTIVTVGVMEVNNVSGHCCYLDNLLSYRARTPWLPYAATTRIVM